MGEQCTKQPHLPLAQELDKDVAAVALVEELGDEVEVGHQRALQDDGHVGGVEQLDGVVLLSPTPVLGTHRQVHPEALMEPSCDSSESWGVSSKAQSGVRIWRIEKRCGGSYLEVDDDHEDGNRGHQLQNVGQAAPVEGLLQGADLHMQQAITAAKCNYYWIPFKYVCNLQPSHYRA